jgi:hypothetical protein
MTLMSALAVTSSAAAQCDESADCRAGQAVAPPLAPRPELYRTERKLVPELYVSGPVLLGATWITTIAVSAAAAPQANAGKTTEYAAIPIVGPWVMLGSSGHMSSYTPAVFASGIAQAAGLAITIAGVTVRREVTVPVVKSASGVRVGLVPLVGGAAAVGTF